MQWFDPMLSFLLGISGCLTLVMGKRAWSSRKFMPSGLVTSLSAVVTVLLLTSF